MAKTSVNTMMKKKLKVGNKFQLSGWLVFDGIALIVIVGVLAVRFTKASVDTTFMRTPQQMTEGTLQRSVAIGEARHIVATGVHAETKAQVTAAELAASSQVCAQFHVNSAKTFVDIQINGRYESVYAEQPGNATVCTEINHDNQDGTVYAGTSGDASVLSIYGTRQTD